jgi:hypothetical protein
MRRPVFIRMSRWFCGALLLSFLSNTLFADTLKKVLILDVVNYEKDPDYDYLQGSITDALTNKLREKFTFKETPKSEWQEVAQSADLVFLDESYTRTFAMSLGITMRQDISISGGFRKILVKNKPIIKGTLFLLDIRNRKVIATIEKNMPPSGDLFSAVDQLAEELAQSAGQVLPGKEQVAKNQAEFTAGDKSIAFVGRAAPVALLGLSKFDERDLLPRPSQLTTSYEFGIRYEVQRLWKFLGAWGLAQGFYSGIRLANTTGSSAIPVTAYGGSAIFGVSSVFDLRSRLHAVPRLGAGYMVAVARQDFSTYERPALDVNSNRLSAVNSLFYGTVFLAGGELVYDLTAALFIEAGVMAQFYLNSAGLSSTLGATLGFGWRF